MVQIPFQGAFFLIEPGGLQFVARDDMAQWLYEHNARPIITKFYNENEEFVRFGLDTTYYTYYMWFDDPDVAYLFKVRFG